MYLRKAKLDEIDDLAKLYANGFQEYDLYTDYILADKKDIEKALYYIYKYDLLRSLDYLYTNDEHTVSIVYIPNGESKNEKYVYKYDPMLIVKLIFKVGMKALKRGETYSSYAEKHSKELMDEKDDYLSLVVIAPDARGQDALRKVFEQFCSEGHVYLETHTLRNKEIYLAKDFVLLDEAPLPYCDKVMGYYMRKP